MKARICQFNAGQIAVGQISAVELGLANVTARERTASQVSACKIGTPQRAHFKIPFMGGNACKITLR
ncbi:hypothetical protein D3C76_1399550 [compost metagenome]